MKRFVVFHNYGDVEGWKIQAECDTLAEAGLAREKDVTNGGGESRIFELVDTFRAYACAEYEQKVAQQHLGMQAAMAGQ